MSSLVGVVTAFRSHITHGVVFWRSPTSMQAETFDRGATPCPSAAASPHASTTARATAASCAAFTSLKPCASSAR